MSTNLIKTIMFISAGLFALIVIAYMIISKKTSKEAKHIKQLKDSAKQKGNSSDVRYQKAYLFYKKIPFLNRYVNKMRRRLEIINLEDEYSTRIQTAKIMTKALAIIVPLTLAIIIITKNNTLLMAILLLFEMVLVESIMSGMVDKIDTKLLKQQIDFFAEIRHAYHEYNMVEEAIYAVAQNDEVEVSRQAEKIYEILTSDDPETELEKYYDVAPNSYLKEFAGISYLTKEFGDRKVEGGSLYLKNLNNITQEMQLEILKRDKLDYVFQSLSFIAAIPVIFIEPLKKWAVSNFSFTNSFYNGKSGLIMQIFLLVVTFICYILIRKIKDNGGIKDAYKDPNATWQAKAYKKPLIKRIVDLFIPKQGTKEYRKNVELLKDAASKQKMETLYINRLVICVVTFFVSLFVFMQIHNTAISYVYEQPSTEYDLVSSSSEAISQKAMETTLSDNVYLNKLKGNNKITVENVETELRYSLEYRESTNKEITEAAQRIYDKLLIINKEYMQWFEWLMACLFAVVAYYVPMWLLVFQKKMRQLEMENEVMQFQTIIMMLMKIERVNVEMILEWLERYSNIFREPISRCVNNYESGAWEALEELKNEVSFQQLIRIIESLQAAVEKIPIADAFDELDTERAYYQEKRKESNERLISKKGLIGKGIGFAPMIVLFVGYLIVPLCVIGLSAMTTTFTQMSSMT